MSDDTSTLADPVRCPTCGSTDPAIVHLDEWGETFADWAPAPSADHCPDPFHTRDPADPQPPDLADRLDVLAGLLRAAAVILRGQDAEIARLKARIDHDREVIHGYSVRVDKLDRIEAASGDDVEWSVALAVCRELAVRYPSWAGDLGITEALLRRLADALEDPGTDG